MSRANNIMNAIVAGKLRWSDLFQRHTFFSEGYKYYLSIVSASPTKEAQAKWGGRVESKVRTLVSGLEMSESGVRLAHPFVKGIERVHHCRTEDEKNMVFQGATKFQVEKPKETPDDMNIIQAESDAQPSKEPETNEDGSVTIYTTTFYVGIELKDSKYTPIQITERRISMTGANWRRW